MTDQPQSEDLEWRDGRVPVSLRFDDPYFSLENGVVETAHVFLAGNDLPARFCDGFHIGELGFGTGLNLLVAWDAWITSGMNGHLHFTSFEKHPLAAPQIEQALQAFPELAPLAREFLDQIADGRTAFTAQGLVAEIVIGDARDTLPRWNGTADCWFLDGFSPAKNPQLWQPELMQAVADHTKPNGTFATYTAAGAVRRALTDAGFRVTRIPGYGRKRHMSIGVRA